MHQNLLYKFLTSKILIRISSASKFLELQTKITIKFYILFCFSPCASLLLFYLFFSFFSFFGPNQNPVNLQDTHQSASCGRIIKTATLFLEVNYSKKYIRECTDNQRYLLLGHMNHTPKLSHLYYESIPWEDHAAMQPF